MKIRSAFYVLLWLIMLSCSHPNHDTVFLEKAYSKLQKIQSAEYYAIKTTSYPGDTSKYLSFRQYVKEISNPADTFVGAVFIVFPAEDTTRMEYCYDGNMLATVYRKEGFMKIDSFQNNRLPFRPVGAPFYTMVKRLIRYVLETGDNMKISSVKHNDTVKYTFTIYDTIVEIIGNRVIYTPSLYGTHQGDVSRYTVWFSAKDHLPFRIIRKMPHNQSSEYCENIRFNTMKLPGFRAKDHFPGLPLQRDSKHSLSPAESLLHKKTPPIILKDMNNTSCSLKDFTGRVLLMEFTSVSCGPCLMSIPMLNRLHKEYDREDLNIISIETITGNPDVLRNYVQQNKIRYPFFLTSGDATKKYHIHAVPTFFILDKNRRIIKIIHGYKKGSTGRDIKDAVDSLLYD
jgi:thiol-disulfide isomerase/thioredoxin